MTTRNPGTELGSMVSDALNKEIPRRDFLGFGVRALAAGLGVIAGLGALGTVFNSKGLGVTNLSQPNERKETSRNPATQSVSMILLDPRVEVSVTLSLSNG